MSSSPFPKVSVCMIAYNVERYVEKAIEGVLAQETTFAVELVIGEDFSKDNTRQLLEEYAKRYPKRIKLLPSSTNRGIAGNAARTLACCQGEYVAICDGDDVWINPAKLQTQVAFLDRNRDYGVSYTDVEVIDQHGQKIYDEDHIEIRKKYASGKCFFRLLKGNFINNSTSVFRKALIEDHLIDEDRRYYTHDYLMWLHIAAKAKVHYWNEKTILYRKHTGSVTTTDNRLPFNREKFQEHLFDMIFYFDQHYSWPLSNSEKAVIFQKLLSILRNSRENPYRRQRILQLMSKYYPGLPIFLKNMVVNAKKRLFSTPIKLLN